MGLRANWRTAATVASCYDTYSHDMEGDVKARWMVLCERAANEQDPARMLELVREINELLEAKERRLGILPSGVRGNGEH